MRDDNPLFFFFSSRRRHTRSLRDWSSDVCSSDLQASPGALVFELEGKSYRLDPVLESGETELFVIFGDRTNGHETYGGGRFLYAKLAVGGKTILDFNRAYNPPCVFTPYATCP